MIRSEASRQKDKSTHSRISLSLSFYIWKSGNLRPMFKCQAQLKSASDDKFLEA